MAADMKATTIWVRNMEKVNMSGKMAATTVEIGQITKSQALEHMSGQTAADMKANG